MDITQYFKHITPISEVAEAGIISGFQRLEYPRKKHLCEQGQFVNHLYFIESGLVRMYYINKQGKDVTYGFYTEGQFVTVPESFFGRTASRYYLELLEDCTLHSVSHSGLMNLMENFLEIRLIENHVLREFLLKTSDRIVALQFLSAEERYQKLNESQPSILQRAPLGNIASYLGITQETLSRIRAKRTV
ncbi:Crp/Fnr family transcriptional regulator [Dyadobacter sp. CY312]|uniref:Crp/Fnr family transcriptional regulator n=1 Tax=Dyadobacter sp. CY312 TaxID=2907303 RepID=UPI001F3F2284|nr:Crp/Fnr family transcriptional regulator [Dyadobacter sp. CY312]MCE7042482.1 Crp/Fnr family transcriptional regulator [Dyadobacter sp. CY312]